MTLAPHPHTDTADTATVSERLMSEFEGRIGLAAVCDTVRECLRELTAAGREPDTEQLESCAREMLLTRIGG